ncbi:hypothetical protein SAY87_005051 [Trapa incisa]|uniref:HECT-type E3 ubiquitin transferase n=1 Tax=Trapa incisa TaxID=236973 RepID=A0AAN7JQP5_9MYRT|nr:hypothetical protein SAY87_005051 [Trapa incisa]
MRSFFTALVKGFTSSNRRRGDSGSLMSASKTLGSGLAKVYLEALSFTGHSNYHRTDLSLSVKRRYLGKIVDDMSTLTFDSRRRTCYASMINNFYVHGTFKELLMTFEATSQLLWTPPYSAVSSSSDHGKIVEENKLSHDTSLGDTLQIYCRELEYFVNSTFLISPASSSQTQQLTQPISTGLSIGLFPVPRDPEVFVQMLQSQVLDVILPVWNHPLFPNCSSEFIASIISLVKHVFSGVGDVKRNRGGNAGSGNQRYMPPPPDEASIATIVEMGFTRARAEEALRRVESNSVEMAMEWLIIHAEDPVQEDDELAQALALSLGSSSETTKPDVTDKPLDGASSGLQAKAPPVDDVLSALVKLFQNSDVTAFPLTDLLVTLCNRNKGEDRTKVLSFLICQLKICRTDFSSDISALCTISHVMALVLSEDGSTREIAAQDGLVSVVIDILMNFRTRKELGDGTLFPKCVSALLLILDNMLQPRPKVHPENSEGTIAGSGSLPEPSPDQASFMLVIDNKAASEVPDKESHTLEKIFGNSIGYLTMDESQKLLQVVCDFIKQHVPSPMMQAVLQICARLTKMHALALQFLENGGLAALFSLPNACFFPGYDMVASAIIRHLLEDPQTLQTAMELEIKQTLTSSRHGGRVPSRTFLISMASVISRDPTVFMKAASAVCQLESSGGRAFVMLKERDKSKSSVNETGLALHESGNKMQDGIIKCSKGHKKVPANFTQVIDQLVDIVLKFPALEGQEDSVSGLTLMEVDEPDTKVKGKAKVDGSKKFDSESERSAGLAKVTFVLILLSDILLMYAHAVGVILKRDLELQGSNQMESSGSCSVLHHILHNLLPISPTKSAGSNEWRNKLSEKASSFLVVLCGRSAEGRKRVISELVKTLSALSNLENNSSSAILLPDTKVLSFSELVYSILSKNSSPGNLLGSGCSADVAKSMIDGGMVQCLASIIRVIDLDHPDSPKIVNLIVRSLESLTRAANISEQVIKSDVLNKKKNVDPSDRVNEQANAPSPAELAVENQDSFNQQESVDAVELQDQLHQGGSPEREHIMHEENPNDLMGQDMRNEVEAMASSPSENIRMDFIGEEREDDGPLHGANRIEVTFHVEGRADDDIMGDEDDIGEDGEDDDDDDDDDGEDEDEAEDGTGAMSLIDTDMEDHDDAGLGDEFNDDMIDEDDDDFHENRVIEVRWREALDGLDHHLRVLRQPGAAGGLIDIAAEPFEGVNIDDLLGLRRTLGFERRRQTGRSSFDRSTAETPGFQHPLLLRPNQAGNMISLRDLENFSSDNFDASQFYMFDAPVLSYDHTPNSLFSTRIGSSSLHPPLSDYSIGLDSLQLPGRRGLSNGRWTDDGQPPAVSQSSAITQAVEEQFLSQLQRNCPSVERQLQESGPQVDALANNGSQQAADGDNRTQRNEDQNEEISNEMQNQQDSVAAERLASPEQINPEASAPGEPMSIQPLYLNNSPNLQDGMEIRNGDGPPASMEGETFLEFVISSMETGSGQVGADVEDMSAHAVDPDNIDGGAVDAAVSEIPGDSTSPAQTTADDIDMRSCDNEPGQMDPSMTMTEALQPETVATENADGPVEAVVNAGPRGNAIDPTFLEALPEDLRAEVLASQQAQPVQPPTYVPPSADEIDPEFLAALPPDIQAEVLAQQRAQRTTQHAQPVDMDNASIIATFPADLREEVLLTSSEAVLSALPSPLLAEAQMLRDRAMSHYQARSLFGSSHRLGGRRNGLGFDRRPAMDRGVGVTIGQRTTSSLSDTLKLKEFDGEQLLDTNGLKALIRLLRLAQPLSKGLLQRLLLNLCAHSMTRANLVHLLLCMIKPEAEGVEGGLSTVNSQRLYGCQSNIIYGRSQMFDGLPPLVLRRVIEVLTYLATNHSTVASMLFFFDPASLPETLSSRYLESKSYKGKEKVIEGVTSVGSQDEKIEVPLVIFLKLLNRPLFSRSTTHFEQVLGLIQVVVYDAATRLESQSQSEQKTGSAKIPPEQSSDLKKEEGLTVPENNSNTNKEDKCTTGGMSSSKEKRSINIYDVLLQLPKSDLSTLCILLGREGLSDKVYLLAGEVLKRLSRVVAPHRKFFILELSNLAHDLSSSAVNELVTLRNTRILGLSAGSMAGNAILRVLQALSSVISGVGGPKGNDTDRELEEQITMLKLNQTLESLWQELSDCIGVTESQLSQSSLGPTLPNLNVADQMQGITASPPLPPGTQRLLPYIEAFFILSEKLQASNSSGIQQDLATITAREVKECTGASTSTSTVKCSMDSQRKLDSSVTFVKFAEKHRRLLNAFIRQNPGLLENSLSMMLKTPRLVDFDNKRSYFRSRIRQEHEQSLLGPLRISVRRAYVLEDSYNQLRMRSKKELKGRLNVHFQGEEGIDAGGLTREWYQLLSRVIFDRGALLFTTVGNNATFQPNPNSVYQTEHLSYFKFVGRVVAKALFDGQLLDVHFTRSFYKHILGIKVTYHDIEAVDPDYYKNLKWMLENDVSDIPDLTFSMDADEEKHILYEKNEVTDYELKPGGRNTRVTEETKHEYVDLVADHILTNAIRTQINSFLDGFNELIPGDLISIFNDKELELLISGLPEIDLEDLRANTEYTGYTAASIVVQWFWDVVKGFTKEDMARLLQFVTGTAKVPLEGFRALQGISGPQKFQIHKAYGAPDRLPSAHTCFNQLDLPEYTAKEQLQDRLLLAIHEASEGFGFG